MIIDKLEAFKALEHYDIRVARSKYVDSAEDAIAFAERRDARDPRLVPIVLRVPSEGIERRAVLAAEKRLGTEEAIRRAYQALVARVGTNGTRIVAQTATEPGSDLVISGRTDDALGKTIAVNSADHTVERMIPLDTAGAEALALHFEGHHHHGSREQVRRMLEHLLGKVSTLFEQTPVTRFSLAVRLHANEYTVLDASLTSPKALHLKERLAAHAHDRKGDDFHAAGRR